jgi:hypothetical protein
VQQSCLTVTRRHREASAQNPAFPRQSGLARSIDFLRSQTNTSLTQDFVVGIAIHICGMHTSALLFVKEHARLKRRHQEIWGHLGAFLDDIRALGQDL